MKRRKTALTHADAHGAVRMVDVGQKAVTERIAVAMAAVHMNAAARRAVRSKAVAKGDPLQTARIAGIMAAKRTADLIPLCHPLPVTAVDVVLVARAWGYEVTATVKTTGQTGVEMEALTAASVAALTIYDMLKAVDRAMTITDVCLLEKRGGRSGHYQR